MNELPLTIQEELVQIYHKKKEKESTKGSVTLTQFWSNTKKNNNNTNSSNILNINNNTNSNNTLNKNNNTNSNNTFNKNNNTNSSNTLNNNKSKNDQSIQLSSIIEVNQQQKKSINNIYLKTDNNNQNKNNNVSLTNYNIKSKKNSQPLRFSQSNGINQEFMSDDAKNKITEYQDIEELIRQWIEIFENTNCNIKAMSFNNDYEYYEKLVNFITKIQNKMIESLVWFSGRGGDLQKVIALMTFFERYPL